MVGSGFGLLLVRAAPAVVKRRQRSLTGAAHRSENP